MRISSYDVWIIKMGTVYLMAVPYIETKTCRLSENIYDAARFDDEELAKRLASKVGGTAIRFNPITGYVQ